MNEMVVSRSINVSLASFPGSSHWAAATTATELIKAGYLAEAALGALVMEHGQLVPQNRTCLTEDLAMELKDSFATTRWRLHANVRVMPQLQMVDLSGYEQHRQWFSQAARISRVLNAPVYSAHSGKRSEASMGQMLDNARRAADLFGCPVAVEGQYPTNGDAWLVSSWAEYRCLFESGVPFAVELSHLNILAKKSGRIEWGLTEEMLACERCLEVHLSSNNGNADTHSVCDEAQWWSALLGKVHENAVFFSEGNHRLALNRASQRKELQ